MAPYWVLPGGHVEAGDPSLRAALIREVCEEVGAEPQITGLLKVIADEYRCEYFYLASIRSWSEADRTGPEFDDPGRGEYRLEEVPLTVSALGAIDLKPEQIAAFLRGAVSSPVGMRRLSPR